MVNDTELVNLACEWLGDNALRERVLVGNPSALYWGV
jgi:hypothetical protein